MKIGLIAMSGVRAHNEELTRLGLTLPGFVERNKTIASLPSLALLTLAALTPEGHEVEYLEIADSREGGDPPLDFDLVALSTYSAQIFEAYEVADYYGHHGIPVVMGGPHVTACPEEAKAHCSAVVVGEGELHWARLVADFDRGELQPFYRNGEGGGFDLASAPIPRFDLLDPEKYNRLTVQTTRGCPHRCEFCASSVLLTSGFKVKPPERILAEIGALKEIWDRPFVELADDNSFVNKPSSRELMRRLADENVRWFAETDLSIARDEELLRLMRDAGCRQVLIGLESPRAESLDGVELRANWKMKQVEHHQEAVDRIQSHGIRVIGCYVLGLDGDTPDIFGQVYDHARELRLSDVQITFLTAFPGTPLYRRLKEEGRLIRDGAWELCTLFDINFVPRNMTVEELQSGFLWLAEKLYSTEETEIRKSGFKEILRSSPEARRTPRSSGPGHP
jgi:radical SAM superfamily enzyme YgiQ (UPF0313 family)